MKCFAVAIQWERGGLIVQEDGLSFDEAFDAVQGYRNAPRPPYRCAFALVGA